MKSSAFFETFKKNLWLNISNNYDVQKVRELEFRN